MPLLISIYHFSLKSLPNSSGEVWPDDEPVGGGLVRSVLLKMGLPRCRLGDSLSLVFCIGSK